MEFVWITLLILSVALYTVLMVLVLPRTFLKTELVNIKAKDRGIKNVKETVGRSIVYQPSLKIRKYIPQYVVSHRKGKKVLICKTSPDVRYIDYDVVMFNGINKPFKAINAKELIENGYTEKMMLDEETAYVTIVVNAVNDEKFKEDVVKPVSGGKITLYALTSALLAFVQVFLMKLCCSYAFGGVFREEFMLTPEGNIITLICGGVVAIVNIILVLVSAARKNRAQREKGE